MRAMLNAAHPDWHAFLVEAMGEMDRDYWQELAADSMWLPGANNLFAAFSLPLPSTRYILLGESPYPRANSANGYAFWDAAVNSLWGTKGFSKEVNRATSLRNLMKMLLHARGDLSNDFSQTAIAALDNSLYLQTGNQLFQSFVNHGFLLLNASLVYSEDKVPYHAKQWRPFMNTLLSQLARYNPSLQLILFGRIATQLADTHGLQSLVAEHPYNLSFISNPDVLRFFKPLDLLKNNT